MKNPVQISMAVAAALGAMSATARADMSAFSTGPVLEDFGPVAAVDADFTIPEDAVLKLSFDVSKGAEPGTLNRTLVSAARFINMHARAGVAPERMRLAVVVHGAAVHDVANAAHYAGAVGGENVNADLIAALTGAGVRVIVCGQSAAYYDVGNDDLAPGVEMALSAMTAHAVLQQDGYAVNPF